jgi:hypothetical protein
MSLPSEPWITLQATDLNDYLVGTQATAVTSVSLAAGQANTWTNVMTDVVNEIRSAIRGSLRNQVSMTPLSIPPDLKRTALVLIRSALAGRIGIAIELTESQLAEAATARRLIERIQENKVVITAPPDPLVPDDQQRGTPVTVVRHTRREFTGRRLRGL